MIDHINRDISDNRISNLRDVTPVQSCMNRGIQSNNTHGDKGVTFTRGYWKASIRVNKQNINIGHFKNKTDAVLAYENAAKEYCGEFYYGGK